MKSIILTLVAASALTLGGAFNSTADAQYRGYRSYYSSGPRYYNNYYRGGYYAPRTYSYYRGYYPYRTYPYYSSYRYGPGYGRYYYNRPYYGGYYGGGRISIGPNRNGIYY
jgi:hypothetical protein